MRQIGEAQLDDIALGAGVLGTGGGGDPYIGKLLAQQSVREYGPVTVVDVSEVDDDALVIPAGMMGAPTVMVEKLPHGNEIVHAFERLQHHLGGRATHTMSLEIGGLNSVVPFCLAARLGLPVVDADLMGRAFPELQMCLPGVFGIDCAPMAVADDKGNASIVEGVTNAWTERLSRSLTVDMGCSSMIALYPMAGHQLRETTITGSLATAEALGRLIRETRAAHGDPIAAILERCDGHHLFTGKVLDVERRTERGFARAHVRVAGLDGDAGRSFHLRTQNEHLVAECEGEVLASVPDLIIVLDSETGQPITTEELRYGFRVAVVALPCDPRWRSAAALDLVGPRYFGYDFDYVPIEQRVNGAG